MKQSINGEGEKGGGFEGEGRTQTWYEDDHVSGTDVK